jgi:hypothetical protein
MAQARMFYVITVRGQVGPFDLIGLREGLAEGAFTADDQVRTPMGSPLGTVHEVINRTTEQMRAIRTPSRNNRDRPAPRRLPAVVIVGGVLTCLALAGLMARGGSGSPHPPADQPASASAPTQSRPVATAPPALLELPESPLRPTAGPATSPKAPPSVAARQAAPPKPAARNAKLPLSISAACTSQPYWVGDTVATIPPQGNWTLSFAKRGAWWVVQMPNTRNDWSAGTALVLQIVGSGTQRQFTCELIEKSGERLISNVRDGTTGVHAIRLPWSSFVRRPADPAPAFAQHLKSADNGLQPNQISALSLWNANDRAEMLEIVAITVE